jgi:adenylosuccinate lyase
MFIRLVESLAATEPLSLVFSDPSVLQAMLDFEAALARAEARCGIIPGAAAEKIAGAAHADGFDIDELAPWHGYRDRLAALMAALSIYTATLGKMALDIALLMQFEVGEAAEPGGDGRGGSSAMPHKRNPTACMLTLSAARRSPDLLADFVNATIQEHERAAGEWQSEWPLVHGIVQSAGVALESMAEVAEGLTVDRARMRSNLDNTKGAVFAEKAVMMLAPRLGREAARKMVEEALRARHPIFQVCTNRRSIWAARTPSPAFWRESVRHALYHFAGLPHLLPAGRLC